MKKGLEEKTIIMRVYNSNTTSEDATIKWNTNLRKAELTDLKEETIKELELQNNAVKLTIPANKIYTIKLTLE